MTVEDLIAQFRIDADDALAPYLWSDEAVTSWLSEAHEEAALRARLLFETATPAVCHIALLANTAVYSLHKSLYELVYLRFKAVGATRSEPVQLVTRSTLDRIRPDWRDEVAASPVQFAIQDERTIQMVPAPLVAGTLFMEGYRFPLVALTDSDQTPEINASHHRLMVHWVLHRAFSQPDTETYDATRAARGEAEFTRYFGARPDAGQRRETQSDRPQHNRAW